MKRNEICEELWRAACTTEGFEWSVDQLVEAIFLKWKGLGAPPGAHLSIERDLGSGAEVLEVTITAPLLE